MDRYDFFGINIDDIKREAKDFADYMKGMAAEATKNEYENGFSWKCGSGEGNLSDLYYPRTNMFIKQDRSIVFEFMLPGFEEKDISLSFKGDKMVLRARAPEATESRETYRFQKRRFEVKDIEYREYPVPADRYEQSKVRAVFKNGVLTVTVPAADETIESGGVKIEIIKEGN